MQRYTVYLYLETALHVSGGISTHHQEHIQPHLQHLALVKPFTATCRHRGRVGTGYSSDITALNMNENFGIFNV
jgi:hypothetical protein